MGLNTNTKLEKIDLSTKDFNELLLKIKRTVNIKLIRLLGKNMTEFLLLGKDKALCQKTLNANKKGILLSILRPIVSKLSENDKKKVFEEYGLVNNKNHFKKTG